MSTLMIRGGLFAAHVLRDASTADVIRSCEIATSSCPKAGRKIVPLTIEMVVCLCVVIFGSVTIDLDMIA